ncbi:hypothetical protein D3C77_759570 [compost metagenome]
MASARVKPSITKTIPNSTTAEASISEKKCSASASSAALSVAFATRLSALTRKKSTTIEINSTAITTGAATISWASPNRLLPAS